MIIGYTFQLSCDYRHCHCIWTIICQCFYDSNFYLVTILTYLNYMFTFLLFPRKLLYNFKLFICQGTYLWFSLGMLSYNYFHHFYDHIIPPQILSPYCGCSYKSTLGTCSYMQHQGNGIMLNSLVTLRFTCDNFCTLLVLCVPSYNCCIDNG